MKKFASVVLAGLTLTSAMAANHIDNSNEGLQIEFLGVNNTLVRVTGDEPLLLLPVQESNDEAKVNILVDGKLDRSLNVRLAKSKVDYMVPFDLTPYAGKNVVLNVITSQDRSSVREAKNDAAWSNITLAETFDTANREQYRPAFHHTPLWGWMNDPNGMFYKDGVWTLCYQWNPYGSKWQNLSWGRSTSTDLVNWEHHPVAVEPDGLGMIFSGSCVVDSLDTAGFGKDAVIAMYTSCDASQIQSMAVSTDNGVTFTPYAGNPTLTLDSEARDPNMFWHEPSQKWILLIAHALEHEMLIYSSDDLKNWTLESAFGKGLGAQDGVWECPDLFEAEIDDSGKTKWVLLCNLNPGGIYGGSATQYFIGDFDGKTFTPDTDADGKVPTKWMDYGKDHYATVSFSNAPDGRKTFIGWMSNWQYAPEVPTKQFRSANTLPREAALFTAPDGDLILASVPSPELDALRGTLVKKAGRTSLGKSAKNFALPTANDGICEVLASISGKDDAKVNLTFSNASGDKVVMIYDVKAQTVSFDRTQAGVSDFSQDFPAVTVTPTFRNDGTVDLRIFVDRASMEVFVNGGRSVMTNLVFPTTPYTTLSISADGGKANLESLRIYAITPTVK